MKSPLVLAYYLPQFHPIPENDEWWGEGFTEWTNVRKAKPLFSGHKQPLVPGELGYYNLMDKEVQIRQSEMAEKYGIDGFIYYQYWFGNGKMLLEKPAEQMLRTPEIKTPFCFCWANETWRGVWHGLSENKMLIEQTFPGKEDFEQYFEYLLPFFKDSRYIKINNKPLFHVFRFGHFPDPDLFIKTFNDLAVKAGFDGMYLIVAPDTVMAAQYEEIYGEVGLDVFQKMRYSKGYIFNVNTIPGRIERRLLRILGYSEDILKRKKPLKFDYVKGVSGMNVHIPFAFIDISQCKSEGVEGTF
jgi:Glycosyltransferase WbsX